MPFYELLSENIGWMLYHNLEELLIALFCLGTAARQIAVIRSAGDGIDREQRDRILLQASAFTILGLSSLIHALVHAGHFNTNLLYQTLLGYCLGFLILVVSLAAERVANLRLLPLLYLPLLPLLRPGLIESLPLFTIFRPLVWVGIAYLSGIVCMLHLVIYRRSQNRDFLYLAFGFLLIFISAVFLFFPARIGSLPWQAGHLCRPLGFIIYFLGTSRAQLLSFRGSILYRALASFCLVAAIPLLTFGTAIFYENISPVNIMGERLMIFLLLLITLASALIFGMGMIIRLVKPLIDLKDTVDNLKDAGFQRPVAPSRSNDEIGDLSRAFNQMVIRLGRAIEEQERMCRLAATGELSATLAHEIKNPLNAIGGAAEYIGKNYQGSLIREFTSIISSEAKRINQLTATLLSFAKQLPPEREDCDLNCLVNDTIQLLNPEFTEQRVTVQVELSPDPCLTFFDSNQIKQVLINLLINAIDAIGPNGTVRISTVCLEHEARLMVSDNGQGIPADLLKEIFNPFFTTKTRGTGLGLAISKKIALEHGGDLLVESVVGRGSTFTLILR